MKNLRRLMDLGFLIICLIINGCAGTPKHLKQEDLQDISKLAIVTFLLDNELKVLDHTGVTEQPSYTGYQFGAIGGLIEGLIKGAVASYPSNQLFLPVTFIK